MLSSKPSLNPSRKKENISLKKCISGIESNTTTSKTMLTLSIPTTINFINYSKAPSDMPEEDKISSPTSTDTPTSPSNVSTQERSSVMLKETC